MTTTILRGVRLSALVCIAAWTSLTAAETMSATAFREALEAIADYTIVEGEHPLTAELDALDKAIIASHADAALRAAYADALAGFLADDATTIDAKWFAARNLYRIGGPAQVEAIAPLLTNPETSDIAVYALQAIPGSEAAQALVEAMRETTGTARVGIINAIAARGDAPEALSFLDELSPLLAAAGAEVYSDAEWAEINAALHAIAATGTPEADAILLERVRMVQHDLQASAIGPAFFMPYYHAWMTHAMRGESAGIAQPLFRYGPLFDLQVPPHVRTGLGLAVLRNAPAEALHAAELFDGDSFGLEARQSFLWRIDRPEMLEELAELLPELPRSFQPLALEALAEKRVKAAAPVAVTLAGNPSEEVRILAIRALGGVGSADDVPLLLVHAGGVNPALARPAVQALERLDGDGINAAIINEIRRGGPSVRAAGLDALAARQAVDSFDAIWRSTEDTSEAVRAAAYNALSVLGDEDTAIELAQAAMQTPDVATREAAGTAMVRIARRTGTQEAVARASLEYLQQDGAEAASYAAAIAILGRLDDPATLPVLVEAARSPLQPIQMAGLRALTQWPTADPLDDMLDLAETHEDSTTALLALGAAIGMVDKLEEEADKLEAYRRVIALEPGAQEVRRVLAGLARLRTRDALVMARTFLDDDDMRRDAEFAVSRIRTNTATASASHNDGDAAQTLDGDAATRWTTGELQHPGQWFQLSFEEPMELIAVVLHNGRNPNDYPRGYAVFISDDGENWGDPIATGTGSEGSTRIAFDPVTTNAIRIEQTHTADAHFWSIHTLEIEWNE